MAPKKKGGKHQQDSDDDFVDPIEAAMKQQGGKGGKGGKKGADSDDDNIPQPAKKGGKKDNKKQTTPPKKQDSEDEQEDNIPQPAKKGGKQQPQKKQQPVVESEEEEDDIPQPVKKGGKKDNKKPTPKKVEVEEEEEEEEEEEIPQPVKKGGKKDKKKPTPKKVEVEEEDEEEEEEEIPQPVKKGGKKDNKKPTPKKVEVEEEEEEEEEDIPQPVKKGGKKDKKKGGKKQVEVEEEEEEEEEIPQPVKKGGKKDNKKGGKKQVEEEEEEEEEEIPQPVKKGGKKDNKKPTPKKVEVEEEEEEEEEDIPQPVKKGGKKDKKKGGKKQEEEEEEKPTKSSKKDKLSSKLSKLEIEDEEEQEEEEEEEEEETKTLTLAEAKAAKAAKKKAKLDKKKEKALKKRQQDDDPIVTKVKEVEIDYDNVDIDDVPGREPPSYVHLRTGAGLRSKIGNDIKFDNLTLSVPGKILLQNASLTLAYGKKYGFVGRNGIGKSCLVKKIASRDEITIAPHLRVLYVEQEVVGDENTPLQCVLRADTERTWLLEEEKVLNELDKTNPNWMFDPREKRNYTLRDIYDRLREIESDKAAHRASTILVGLGFTLEEISTKPSKDYSGGWRMRIALARALFCKPEVLLLDEPSNHLDLHACVWLEKYLNAWDRTLLVVSHEATFLNEVVDNIIHIHDQRLDQYRGNYDAFLKQREVMIKTKENKMDKIERKVKKDKEFIQKNKNNTQSKKASSVKKKLEKIEVVVAEKEDKSLVVSFPDPEKLTPPLLRFDNVSFGYPGKGIMFRNLEIGVDMDSKIALVGMNGVGKSTLMKLMIGDLHETEGYIERSRKMRIARFSQHFVDQLDTDQTPIEYFQTKFSNPPVQEIRNHLGRFGICGNLPLHKITTLSGGQKSRVILAELAWAHPHILLLDEPTNHLDIDAIEALATGINAFQGGVVLISHNQHLINMVANEIWVVKKDGTVTKYDGDFMDYKEEISRELDHMVVTS